MRQGRLLLAAFNQDQPLDCLDPAPPPDARRVAFAADAVSDVLVVVALKGEQNHACPLGEGLGTGTGAGHGLKNLLLTFRENDLGSPSWHGWNLPKRSVKVGCLGKYRKATPIVEA